MARSRPPDHILPYGPSPPLTARLTAFAVLLVVLAARAMLVTTEKDFVRLPDEAWPMVEVLGVRLLWADAEALNRVLAPLLAPA